MLILKWGDLTTCLGVENITIGDNATIKDQAFNYADIPEITIGNNCKIGAEAFWYSRS